MPRRMRETRSLVACNRDLTPYKQKSRSAYISSRGLQRVGTKFPLRLIRQLSGNT